MEKSERMGLGHCSCSLLGAQWRACLFVMGAHVHSFYISIKRISRVVSKNFNNWGSRYNVRKWVWPICSHSHMFKDREMMI